MFHSNSLYFSQVSNEEIYTAYDVQVRATNSYGKGPFSDISVAHTAELGEDFQKKIIDFQYAFHDLMSQFDLYYAVL